MSLRGERKDFLDSKQYLSRIRDSNFQRFATAAEAIVAGRSPEAFRATVLQLKSRERLFFIQRWLVVNSDQQGAHDLIDDALNSLVEDTKYLPLAKDLREISSPLLSVNDKNISLALLRRIDAHRGAIAGKSPTLDMLKLDIQLAKIEARIDYQLAADRLLRMSFEVMGQTDQGAQLECYARLLRAAEEVDPNGELESKEGFRTIFSDGLNKTLGSVLKDTADHFEVLKGVLRAFAEFDPKRGLEIAQLLNIERRRDRARFFLAVNTIQHGHRPIQIDLVINCIDQIENVETRSDALKEVAKGLAKHAPPLNSLPTKVIEKCLAHHPGRFKAELLMFAVEINDHYKAGFDTDILLDQFHALVCTLDPLWQRRALGYRMVGVLKKGDPARSNIYFDRLCEAERSFGVASSNLAQSREYLVRLSIVAWASLLKKRGDSEEELIRLRGLIADIPSFDVQSGLYAEICTRAWLKQRPDLLEKMCQKWVIPLVEALRKDDIDIFRRAMSRLFPTLYLWRQPLALGLVKALPLARRDAALTDAIFLIITKRPLSERFSDRQLKGVVVTYDEALLIVDLISHVESDFEIGGAIDSLTTALKSNKSLQRVNEIQRAELADKLKMIVDSKLPDQRNIKHEGWKLFCTLKIDQLKNAKAVNWDDYLRRAKAIPNCADRVLVLAELAGAIPVKRRDLAIQAFECAREDLKKIPAAVDRISRAIEISKSSSDDARLAAEGLLKQALVESLSYPDEDVASEARREAIDAASQIDEEMARRLVEIIDDDPARNRARAETAKQLQVQETRKAVLEARRDLPAKQVEHLAAACWDALGSLNAGRCATSRPSDLTGFIELAAAEGIGNSYPIFLWYLKNLEVRFEATKESETTLKPLLEVLLMVSDLANRIVRRLCDDEYWPQSFSGGNAENRIITPADREEAIDHICAWAERIQGDELLICDPYFGPDDLELIQRIHFRRCDLKYTVLISPEAGSRGQDLREIFRKAWKSVSDTPAPPIRVVIVMFKGTHKGPIHDRWLLGSADGMRVGTSVNGLGTSRWSEISMMERESAGTVREELLRFARLQEWFANGGVQVEYEVTGVQ